jgi:hypothetical protein
VTLAEGDHRATYYRFIAAMALAAAAALFVTKDWLLAWGLRVGLAEHKARVHSGVMVHFGLRYSTPIGPIHLD